MQLKIQRSQRAGGVMGNTVYFCLDVRADYSAEERSNIQRYKLGSQIVYQSQAARKHIDRANAHLDDSQSQGRDWHSIGRQYMSLAKGTASLVMSRLHLNISIASLGRGHHIECKDLEEMCEAEGTVRNACKNLTQYLDIAATFDGSETVIEYDKGEERIHITRDAVPLIEYEAGHFAPAPSASGSSSGNAPFELGRELRGLWDDAWEQWFEVEREIIAFAKSKGWSLSTLHIRAACGVTGLLLVIVLTQV